MIKPLVVHYQKKKKKTVALLMLVFGGLVLLHGFLGGLFVLCRSCAGAGADQI